MNTDLLLKLASKFYKEASLMKVSEDFASLVKQQADITKNTLNEMLKNLNENKEYWTAVVPGRDKTVYDELTPILKAMVSNPAYYIKEQWNYKAVELFRTLNTMYLKDYVGPKIAGVPDAGKEMKELVEQTVLNLFDLDSKIASMKDLPVPPGGQQLSQVGDTKAKPVPNPKDTSYEVSPSGSSVGDIITGKIPKVREDF